MAYLIDIFRALPAEIGFINRIHIALVARPRMLFQRDMRYQETPEVAIDAVARSAWARNLASQQAIQLGFTPGTEAFNNVVNTGAKNLAARFLKGVSTQMVQAPVEEAQPTEKKSRGRPQAGTGKTTR